MEYVNRPMTRIPSFLYSSISFWSSICILVRFWWVYLLVWLHNLTATLSSLYVGAAVYVRLRSIYIQIPVFWEGWWQGSETKHTQKTICNQQKFVVCIAFCFAYGPAYTIWIFIRIWSWWRWSWRSYAVLSHLLCFLVMIGFCVWLGAVRKILIMFSISFFCF